MSNATACGHVRTNNAARLSAKLHARRAMQWCVASCAFAMLFMYFAQITFNAAPFVMLALLGVSLRKTYVHIASTSNQVPNLNRASGYRYRKDLDRTTVS